jgi:hypothetical protein
MYDACTEEPETAWQSVLEILKLELTDDQRALLAAGPMEDLLAWHGPGPPEQEVMCGSGQF